MKKARKVEIKEIITIEEYEELLQHAKNSATWYQTNYFKNSNQIREKLYTKGYPKDSVKIQESKERKNIVEETITYLEEIAMLDDDYYTENLIRGYLGRGKGINYIKQKAREKRIPKKELEKVLEGMETEYHELTMKSLHQAVKRVKRSSAYKKRDNNWEQKQYLTQRLLQQGFSYSDIREWEEENGS